MNIYDLKKTLKLLERDLQVCGKPELCRKDTGGKENGECLYYGWNNRRKEFGNEEPCKNKIALNGKDSNLRYKGFRASASRGGIAKDYLVLQIYD